MSRPGGSAQQRYEHLRKQRLEKRRRNWWLIVVGVAGAFFLGYVLPSILVALLSTYLVQLAPDSSGIQLPVDEFLLSMSIGSAFAVAAAIGLLRPSRSEVAWRKGASGERRVGRTVDALGPKGATVLHDRAMPGARGNIDHIVVTSAGVFVVDAKRYTGRLQTRSRGSQLWVNGRNRSHLLAQVHTQVESVKTVLAQAGFADVKVVPVLCFVDTEMPLFAPRHLNGVIVCSTNTLRRRVLRARPPALSSDRMARVVDMLESTLRPATGGNLTVSGRIDEVSSPQPTLSNQDHARGEPGEAGQSRNTTPSPSRARRQRQLPSRKRTNRRSWLRIANFRGRTRRREYWAAVAVALVATLIAETIDASVSSGNSLRAMVTIGALVWPFWGASVNRLHDIGKSGWMSVLLVVPLVNLFVLLWLGVMPGQREGNRWGSGGQ